MNTSSNTNSQQTWQFVSVDPDTLRSGKRNSQAKGGNTKKDGRPRKPRVSKACVRCRKHKLRCDNYRPCMLCVRSDVACVDAEAPSRAHKEGTTDQQPPTYESVEDEATMPALVPSTHPPEQALSEEQAQWTRYEVPTWEEAVGQGQGQSQYQEGVNNGDDLEDVQFDGDWDWNAGHFLSPDLWPPQREN